MRKKHTFLQRILTCLIALCFAALTPAARGEELHSDYSALSWMDAFDRLHARLSAEYAFTGWKGIDWDALGGACRAKIGAAQAVGDFEAYYLSLRTYIGAIPDGHVRISNLPEIDNKYVGGGYGFAAALLDDGRIVASWVDESSAAFAAGLRAGNELVTWNGLPASQACANVSVIWTTNAATNEDKIQKQVRYLARASIGAPLELGFRPSTSGTILNARLNAYDDQSASLKKCYPDSVVPDKIREMLLGIQSDTPMPKGMVTFQVLEGNTGYIRLLGEFDADLTGAGTYPSTLKLFRDAIASAIGAGCTGLILDIRNNVGGLDDMAAAMLGSFYSQETVYEYLNVYDPQTGTRSVQPAPDGSEALMIKPAEALYTGRVIALVNQKCLSSGEGLAMGIGNLENGDTLGFFGTNGSFGLAGPEASMPGSLTVSWPSGQSLDARGEIQIDSRDGIGGTAPTIRVPMTLENALAIAQGEDVELRQALMILRAH